MMDSNKDPRKNKTGYSLVLFTAVLVFLIMSPCHMTLFPGNPFNQGIVFAETKDKPITINDIAAEVNGEKVTIQDVLKRYNIYSMISRYSAKKSENLKFDMYLDIYLMEFLLLREAEEMKIKVDREEVEKEKKKYLTRNNLTEEQLLEHSKKIGLTREDISRYFENNLILTSFGDKKFGVADVSDEDARKFYSNNEEYYNRPASVTVSHILICHEDSQGCNSTISRQEAENLAKNVRKHVTPDNFSRLAKQYSFDRTGANDGDLGTLTPGSAVPAFEKAAFGLDAGEISGVVETDFGFHIIYVRNKQEAISIKFEEARETIKNDIKKRIITVGLINYYRDLLGGANIKKYADIDENLLKKLESASLDSSKNESAASSGNGIKTFRITDKNVCKNSKGQPIVLLFSTADCPHCSWIAETFDETVLEYAKRGLIEAHHYDLNTRDDLLTPEIERDIPEIYVKIGEEGSQGYVPYFNFGCMYDRISNGYEKEDDLYAEEVEMRQIIEFLLK